MTREQMLQIMNGISQLENDLETSFSSEEKDLIFEKGWKKFITDYLNVSLDDWKSFLQLKKLLVCYLLNHECFIEKLTTLSENTKQMIKNINYLVNDSHSCVKESPKVDSEKAAIEFSDRMKAQDEWIKSSTLDPINLDYQMHISEIIENLPNDWRDTSLDMDNLNKKYQELLNTEINEEDVDLAMIDYIKDEIVDKWCKTLLENKGMCFTIPTEVRNEVVDKLWREKDNISIAVINNRVTVK